MMQFFIRDDVYQAGTDECGGVIERLVYYVVAEAPNGRRYAHGRSFVDNGVWKAGASAAQYLLDQITAAYMQGTQPNWAAYWTEIDPAYGSDAYQGLDNERFFRNREVEEAFDGGEIGEHEAMRLMTL
jgi:hypothetical protein